MKKKKIIIVLLCVLIAVAACAAIAFGKGNTEELALKANQRYVYAYITSIQGNEITYMEVDESVVTAMSEPETEAENTADREAESGKTSDMGSFGGGEMPDMSEMFGSGEMPDMGSFGGGEMFGSDEMPDMGSFEGGEMPDMSEMFGSGEMPDMGSFGGGEMPDMGSFGGGEMPDMSNFPSRGDSSQKDSERGESSLGSGLQFGNMTSTVTTYIPVGVVVHTTTGVSTTFSRLASGDLVKILVESNDAAVEIIEEIWMLQ